MKQHYFENSLELPAEELQFVFYGIPEIPWAQFHLNPRRLRGSDFLMRWSQGVWSERRLIDAVNATDNYYAIPYGPSGVAPDNDPREFELYFERLDAAMGPDLKKVKRPDILIFESKNMDKVVSIISRMGGKEELPFTREDKLSELLGLAILAVECENSLWVADKMPAYGENLRPMKRLGGKPGLRKNAVTPTVIIKEEDKEPLCRWQLENKIPIHIWHVFYERAFGLSLDDALDLLAKGLIEPTIQIFQAPGGTTTQKAIYKFYHHYAYELGIAQQRPELIPKSITDKNGHILPYVRFEGGTLSLYPNVLEILKSLEKNHE